MFIDIYYRFVLVKEFFFKLNIYLVFIFSVFFFFQLLDLLKYEIYIFSRFFRNIRLNFFFFFRNLVCSKVKFYLKRRYKVFFLRVFFNFLGGGVLFFFVFEYFILYIYRVFFNFKMCLYFYKLKCYNFIKFSWYDIYTSLIDLTDSIANKENFLFKYDMPKMIYNLYMYYTFIRYHINILTFLGFKFFLRKRKFKFKFYSRIV
jgi:hypothetical protein